MNTFLKDFLKEKFRDHTRNSANIIGEMGGISTMIFTNFNLRMSQFIKRGRLVWFLFKQKKMLEEHVHPPSDAYARS